MFFRVFGMNVSSLFEFFQFVANLSWAFRTNFHVQEQSQLELEFEHNTCTYTNPKHSLNHVNNL
jgi:hypothetical protein